MERDCRLRLIVGFKRGSEIANSILSGTEVTKNTIVIIGLKSYPSYVYGHSNFMLFEDDPYNWKFIRTLNQISEANVLGRLQEEMGHDLSALIFTEQSVYNQFVSHNQLKKYQNLFMLI